MRIEINLRSDSYNSYCNDERIYFDDEQEIRIILGDREVNIYKDELKKVISILY